MADPTGITSRSVSREANIDQCHAHSNNSATEAINLVSRLNQSIFVYS